MHHAHRSSVLAQGLARVRCGVVQHVFRRAIGYHLASGFAALRAEVNQPIAGANHVQVVLNHHQRMTHLQQLAQCAHELGNVVKVQARGGLVQHEQGATRGQGLLAGSATLGRLCQKPCQLEALCLTARQGRHGLAQLDVFQPHIHDGLQGANDIAVIGKQIDRLADREVQHIGHVHAPHRRLT